MLLDGYKALITGATSGMGLSIAREFIDEGATVIGVGRNFSRTGDLGEKFIPFKCDVSNMDEIKAACAFADETFDGLDILVCNAGRGSHVTVETITPEEYDDLTAVLLRAPAFFTKYCLPNLRKSKLASIIHTCSIGSFGIPGMGIMIPYYMAKSALFNYVRQCVASPAMRGIRVNAISPGIFDTNIAGEKEYKLWEQHVFPNLPIPRVGYPEEIAKAAVFLSSEKARCISGSNFLIDGGYTTILPSATAKL